MRRRLTRGGRDTHPLHSDDSDQEEGRSRNGEHPRDPEGEHAHNPEGAVLRNNEHDENDSSRDHSSSGLANHIHDSETLVVGGANGDNRDSTGGASKYNNNTALNRLTMDAYDSCSSGEEY